ncbi:uncharacterized protein LOC134206557 [Armigeres subalbatus]|uniref:uncharacterized protein LOC134206557 n=1 Tax=Armigeres subalbatus TaxID=124917 RepID=UPI002ED2602C
MAPPAGASASKAPSMRALTARLKAAQLSFNDIQRFTEAFSDANTVTEVEIRIAKLDELWESYSATMVEIFAHEEYNEEKTSLEKERAEFSDRCYEIKSFLTDKIKSFQKPLVLEQPNRGGNGASAIVDHVRLPQIQLQTFNGDIDEWLSFRDLFTSLIHWKVDLPEVEKLHYLKGCLQGEPKALIDPLPITKANYQVAWDLLLKRYNNSKQLRKRQVQALFKLPTLSKESGADLHTLIEGFERIVHTLDQVVQPNEYKDLLFVNILTARLDPVTRRGWEEVSSAKQQDTLEDLFEFLRRRIQVLDSLPAKSTDTRGAGQIQQYSKAKQSTVKTSYSSTQASRGRCVVCSSDHFLYQCNEFHRMTVSDRDSLLKTHGLCRNCFRTGHHAKECQSKYSWEGERTQGGGSGNQPSVPKNQRDSSNTQVANVAATETVVSATAHQHLKRVLLATAVVMIEDDIGNRFPARALLDSGSESNFITERLSQRLKVHRDRVDISVAGIGQAATKVRQRIQAVLHSRVSEYSRELALLVLPKVTVNLPTTTINTAAWTLPSGIQLADPTFFESNGVDIVLGIEYFFDFSKQEKGFLWGNNFQPSTSPCLAGCNVSALDGLDTLIARFWSCEAVESGKAHSPEEKRCEEWFSNTVQRDTHGRYTVALPMMKGAVSRLGKSRDIAFRRLQGTERRLARDSSLRKQYVAFMEEYLNLGHMKMLVEDSQSSIRRCYLPHHPVVKEASTTTKVRVVFDASCKTSSGVSLNDVLLVRPIVQDDLRSIILRCRTKQIMLVSDVEKMFRQVIVRPEDRPLQCILWRNSPSESVLTYELNTVTYGTKPAPFLATRTLQQLAVDEKGRFPLAARATMDDTYIDDVITGANDVETATQMQIQLNAMLSRGGFQLRKWASNCPAALAGLLGAAITTAKIFMQLLWIIRDKNEQPLTWDQPLPPMVGESWRRFHEQLPMLNQARIERCVIIPESVDVELHCFSDASEKAYGACLYVRSTDADGRVKVRLLSSKSKVAPLKCQTIPRLELCGAVLAAQLYEKVRTSIKTSANGYFWTDSTCVLRWLQAYPTTWTTFVANRTAKIQSITEGCRWSHVPGIQNPADLISRGIAPQDIIDNQFWWRGPTWLEESSDKWPRSLEPLTSGEEESEKRRTIIATTASSVSEFNQEYISKFSSYNDLIRRTAYWLRLMKLLRTPITSRNDVGFLTTSELRDAEGTLVRLVQKEVFAEELKAISSGGKVPNRSQLRWFNPFLSKDQLLKLGGRLKHSLESDEAKHPVVLPARHQFTRLLLQHYHEHLLHAGPQLMLSVLRLRFWPLGGRSVIRNIVHRCQKCFRCKPTSVQQFMGDLPAARVTVSRPFSDAGVDYFGPVYLRPIPRRATVKAYVAVFVCLCMKAVHLELVSDLSTDRFLQALRRFVARRGLCTNIYSDNGTNFVGARNQLKDLLKLLKSNDHNSAVSKECAKVGIQWHFIPPSAPHFGGLWEAAVRSTKHHLLRVIGESPVSPEDFTTLLTQVEACLNSRPLTPLSDDPNDLEPLTPAHFLIGTSLLSIPEPELGSLPNNRLNALQLIQKRLQDFWKRWRREYLCQLQSRNKRFKSGIQIEVGKLVVIKDDNQPPMKWRMGRISDIHPGSDGIVRVVTLKTANGSLIRPIEKLCFLPLPEEDDRPSGTTNQPQ